MGSGFQAAGGSYFSEHLKVFAPMLLAASLDLPKWRDELIDSLNCGMDELIKQSPECEGQLQRLAVEQLNTRAAELLEDLGYPEHQYAFIRKGRAVIEVLTNPEDYREAPRKKPRARGASR